MADFPLSGGGQRAATIGATSASSNGTNATSGAANTKGSWTELVAATAFDVRSMVLTLGPAQAGATGDYLADVAIGAAASEQVIIANVCWHRQTTNMARSVRFDVAIPAGSRIAVRHQRTSTAVTLNYIATLFGGTFLTPIGNGICTTYGANTTDSGGVSIDPGGSGNTKGAWSEITSATTRNIRELVIGFTGQANGTRTVANWLFDIGIGAAASETIIVADLHNYCDSAGDDIAVVHMALPISIPIGSRIAVRSQSDITDATDRLVDVIIYGFD